MLLFKVAEEEPLQQMRLLVLFTAPFRNTGPTHTWAVGLEGLVFGTACAVDGLTSKAHLQVWLARSPGQQAAAQGATLPHKGAFTAVVFSAWVRRSLNT